ncbi:MAG TPA: dihydrodipicolinate synthase family protein [Ktedonobacteraceae bacterium]|nr:dihydrodipicolinate synthase family protein [Ktedonobacteraceae bacterium]
MLDVIPAGIYPPVPTFFDADEELDLATLRRHVQGLNQSGITGYVVMGSNGESVHLSGDERVQVIETVREAAGADVPILAGCGEQSTRATIANCQRAARAGADVALILPAFYFRSRMNNAALLAHYRAIADSSLLPVVIYNMPGNAAGVDLDTATICTLAEHPNIIGVKDSSGNMAKLAQVVAATASSRFRAFAGSAGYLLPALAVGASGAVAALANIFPREVCRVQELFLAGQLEEARIWQARLAPANTAVTTTYNVPGLKAALELFAGYGGRPRLPLLPLNEQERIQLAAILEGVRA